jgi:hypothetical protein
MTIPEEKIIAYVDGELDADSRAEVEAAAAADPDVTAALLRHRTLRRRLAEAHADVLHEPPPAALEALIRGAELRRGPAEIVDLSARRAQRSRPTLTRRAQPWALLAAGFGAGLLVMGLVLGRPTGFYAAHDGQLTARGQLARTLDRELASDAAAGAGPVRIGLSFKARDGRYCRTFTAPASLTGVACREGPSWNIRAAVFAGPTPAETPYRTAAAGAPAPVLSAVQDMIDGAPLDAGAEKAARARGWR